MNIASIMTPAPATCHLADSMHDAAAVMWEQDCGGLPVLDEAGNLVGMITDRDICMAALTQAMPLASIRVEVGLSERVFYVRPDATVEEAERLMRRTQTRRLPVLDGDGSVVGILSLSDIARQSGSSDGEVAKAEVADTLAAIGRPRPHH